MERAAQCEEPKSNEDRIWRDACKYYEQSITTSSDYIQPDEYAALDFAETLEPTDYTEVGQANVFSDIYGDRVKYTPATKFIVYNGTVWQESEMTALPASLRITGIRRRISSHT